MSKYFSGSGEKFRFQEKPFKDLIRSTLELPINNLIKQLAEWQSTEKTHNDGLVRLKDQLTNPARKDAVIKLIGQERYEDLVKNTETALTASNNILKAMDEHLTSLVEVGPDGKNQMAMGWSDKIEDSLEKLSKIVSENIPSTTGIVILFDRMLESRENEKLQTLFSNADPPYDFASDFIRPVQRNPRHEMLAGGVLKETAKARALGQSSIDVNKTVDDLWNDIDAKQKERDAFSKRIKKPLSVLSEKLVGKQESSVEELIRINLIDGPIKERLKAATEAKEVKEPKEAAFKSTTVLELIHEATIALNEAVKQDSKSELRVQIRSEQEAQVKIEEQNAVNLRDFIKNSGVKISLKEIPGGIAKLNFEVFERGLREKGIKFEGTKGNYIIKDPKQRDLVKITTQKDRVVLTLVDDSKRRTTTITEQAALMDMTNIASLLTNQFKEASKPKIKIQLNKKGIEFDVMDRWRTMVVSSCEVLYKQGLSFTKETEKNHAPQIEDLDFKVRQKVGDEYLKFAKRYEALTRNITNKIEEVQKCLRETGSEFNANFLHKMKVMLDKFKNEPEKSRKEKEELDEELAMFRRDIKVDNQQTLLSLGQVRGISEKQPGEYKRSVEALIIAQGRMTDKFLLEINAVDKSISAITNSFLGATQAVEKIVKELEESPDNPDYPTLYDQCTSILETALAANHAEITNIEHRITEINSLVSNVVSREDIRERTQALMRAREIMLRGSTSISEKITVLNVKKSEKIRLEIHSIQEEWRERLKETNTILEGLKPSEIEKMKYSDLIKRIELWEKQINGDGSNKGLKDFFDSKQKRLQALGGVLPAENPNITEALKHSIEVANKIAGERLAYEKEMQRRLEVEKKNLESDLRSLEKDVILLARSIMTTKSPDVSGKNISEAENALDKSLNILNKKTSERVQLSTKINEMRKRIEALKNSEVDVKHFEDLLKNIMAKRDEARKDTQLKFDMHRIEVNSLTERRGRAYKIKAEIEGINQALKEVASSVENVITKLDSQSFSVESVSAELEVFRKRVSEQETALENLEKALGQYHSAELVEDVKEPIEKLKSEFTLARVSLDKLEQRRKEIAEKLVEGKAKEEQLLKAAEQKRAEEEARGALEQEKKSVADPATENTVTLGVTPEDSSPVASAAADTFSNLKAKFSKPSPSELTGPTGSEINLREEARKRMKKPKVIAPRGRAIAIVAPLQPAAPIASVAESSAPISRKDVSLPRERARSEDKKEAVRPKILQFATQYGNFKDRYNKGRGIRATFGIQRSSRKEMVNTITTALGKLKKSPTEENLDSLKTTVILVEKAIEAEKKQKSYKVGASSLEKLCHDMKKEIEKIEEEFLKNKTPLNPGTPKI